jgi:5-methylcytosine-specific restriction endonuclease McrA
MITKKELYHLYWGEKLSIREIADKYNTNYHKIRNKFDEYNISKRSNYKDNPKRINKNKLKKMYYDKEMTLKEIGEKIGARASVVLDWMHYYNLETRSAVQRDTADIPRKLLKKLYIEKEHSIYEIQKITGYNRETVRRYMKKYNIDRRDIPRGENHPNYNPNLTDKDREKDRVIPGYYKWRKSVYERDNYTCQVCGSKSGDIVAHHIESYASNPELRTDIDNGIVMCEGCHIKFHSIYGINGATKENLNEFIEKYSKEPKTKQLSLFEAS